MSWCLKLLVLLAPYVFIFLVKVTEWPPIGKIAAHLAYNTLMVPHGKQLRSILSYKPSSSQVSFP